jgi:RNA polymerase sigma factor (sigma-70 family)
MEQPMRIGASSVAETLREIEEVARPGFDGLCIVNDPQAPDTATTAAQNGGDTEEATLIRRIIAGRRELFGELIAPHLTPLLRVVRATMGSHAEVDDIVQQTVVKAFTRLEQFRFEAGFRTWLIQIGLNEARQWWRKNASSPFVKSALTSIESPIVDQGNSPFVEYQRSETIARLSAAVAHLPEKYRKVIVLRDFEDRSISEVAVTLGLTIATVKSRHRRARQKVSGFLTRPRSFQTRPATDDRPEFAQE